MGYRFIDTNFFKSPYVRGLKGTMKYLYGYIITDCSSAGIWTVDIPIACIYIDSRIEFNEAKKVFIESGKAIDLGNGKWFFPDFIQHQYPKGLSEKNPAHNNIILELKKYNLLDENLNVIKGTTKGLQSTSQGTMVMVMDKVMDKDMDINKKGVRKKIELKIPTEKEFSDYFISNGFSSEIALRAFNGYKEADWHDSHGNKIKNWKQKCQHVWFRPENKTTYKNDPKHSNSNKSEQKIGRIPISEAERFMQTRTGIPD